MKKQRTLQTYGQLPAWLAKALPGFGRGTSTPLGAARHSPRRAAGSACKLRQAWGEQLQCKWGRLMRAPGSNLRLGCCPAAAAGMPRAGVGAPLSTGGASHWTEAYRGFWARSCFFGDEKLRNRRWREGKNRGTTDCTDGHRLETATAVGHAKTRRTRREGRRTAEPQMAERQKPRNHRFHRWTQIKNGHGGRSREAAKSRTTRNLDGGAWARRVSDPS